MTDPIIGSTAFGDDRYEIQHKLGAGGMAVVYLARDVRHDRMVAIKILRPELAHVLGTDRFLREIRVAAKLSHPNILALFDSGERDGLLYYVMPYVEGESLADRLKREGQLGIDAALAIARQVATALHHAHGRGVVHRDIKPGNILLAGSTALVADFGIAHAAGQAGEDKLTSTGIIMGTPSYMSPEQIAGSARLDGRSDVYSLGCVMYEMLVGEPPFSGPSAQAILARHSIEHVPSLRIIRSTIPPAVELVVHKALAKSPADRFASAGDLGEALSPENLAHATVALPRPHPLKQRRWLVAVLTVFAIVAAALAIRPWAWGAGRQRSLDDGVVAVVPFGVVGGANDQLARLTAQLPAMVVQLLPGDGGPRGIAAGGSEVLTKNAAVEAAENLGAGWVLLGQILSAGNQVKLSATISSVTNDAVSAQMDVTGPMDSVPGLLDRLITGLLVRRTTEPESHRAALELLPLPSVRTYLGGIEAFFKGQFMTAEERYSEVLRVDSTFYPAALGLAALGEAGSAQYRHAKALALAQRGRMNEADSTWLDALIEHPDLLARLIAYERAVNVAVDRPERWFFLGERLFHDGPLLGIPNVLTRATQSFQRAIELRPSFVPALGHLIDLAAAREDSASVRVLGQRYFAADSLGDLSGYYRWRVAVGLGDERALAAIRSRFDSLSPESLELIVNTTQLDGLQTADALRAAEALWVRSSVGKETRWSFVKQRELALNRGRPAEATALLARQVAATGFRNRDAVGEMVNALYWGADTVPVARWIAENEQEALSGGMRDVHLAHCAVGLWEVRHRDLAGTTRAVQSLRQHSQEDPREPNAVLCAELLETEFAFATNSSDAALRLARLDSLAGAAPPALTWILVAANLTAARLWEAAGEPERALAAVRRRLYITNLGEPRVLVALSTTLREEGRLAALTGANDDAALAYRRYLALRADAEPALAAEVEGVRKALAALTP